MTGGPKPSLECPCAGAYLETGFRYDAPPVGETAFRFAGPYRRAYQHCRLCGHWFAEHDLDMSGLYGADYVSATYGNRMRATHERIMALPPERSDNAGRCARVDGFARRHLPALGRPWRLLDVGSGLAVFPAGMRRLGWECTAVDPDPAAAELACTAAGAWGVTGDFLILDHTALGRFEAVTFNKVLEHVEAPVAMLRAAIGLVEPHGFVYVELPDGEAAAAEGPGREEFFIEHHHVFSPASVVALARRAGFRLIALERLREPSMKFTLRAFLAPTGEDSP